MTVLDTSGVVDFLLGEGAAADVATLLEAEGFVAAPDLVVFETLAVLRRAVRRGELRSERAEGAVEDLGDLALQLFPALSLRRRAWRLREKLTVAEALFVALAQLLGEPLATKDERLAAAGRALGGVVIIEL